MIRQIEHPRQSRLPYVLLVPSFAVLVAILVWPSIYNLWLSLWSMRLSNPDAATYVGVKNFTRLLTDELFWQAARNTFVFVSSAVLIEFVLGLISALMLSQKSNVTRRIIGSLLILPYMIAGSVSGLTWRLLWTYEYGLVNFLLGILGIEPLHWLADPSLAMVSVVITEVWRNTPFITLVLLAGLMSIPREIHEAARVDGTGVWQRFFRITLPLLSPSISIALLFRTIFAIRVFDVVYTLTRGGPGSATLPLGILLYYQTFRYFQVGQAASLAIVILAIGMVISYFYMRLLYRRVEY